MRLLFSKLFAVAAFIVCFPFPSHAGANTELPIQSFTFGGDAPWFLQSAVSHDGIGAYQSGAITNSQTSWMETAVTGPGAIRFFWKVSSESCCDPLTFSIDGAGQANIQGEIGWQNRAFAIPAGSHAVRWTYSTDSTVLSGSNAGWVDQVTFEAGSNIDVTPPVTTATPAAGMYASSQSVALSCADNFGCTGTFYCLGTGCNPTTSFVGPITVASATDLRFYSTDAAGNSEQVKTATYTFDTTAPTTSVYPSGGSYSGPRDVTLYCYDYGMGCASTYYCLGTGCTPTTPYSAAIAITASTDLRFYSTDKANNSEIVKTATFTITPDVTAPTTTPNYSGGTYSPIYLYLSCYDGVGSGCAATYYCLGAGCTPTTPYNNYVYLSTSTDVRFYSVDRSGNSEAIKTVTYTIDASPPVTTPNPSGGIFPAPQNVTLSCNDGTGSGCSATYYCLGTGCYPGIRLSGPIAVATSTDLTFYSEDNVRNDEAWKRVRYTIATTPPATINVPADRATIQAAIDAAHDGDTILVAPGTYVENIDFKGKAITVQSSNGPDVTIIDGNKQGSVVVFSSDEWTTSVLSGFTIRNGGPPPGYGSFLNGGGIYINGASPTITNNKIIQNQGGDGAGIYAGGSPIIRGNLISNNSRAAGYSGGYGGGGIYLCGDSAQIVENTISNNAITYAAGGGIYLTCSGVNIIRGNVISHNGGTGVHGGGIYIDGSSTNSQIVQNLVVNNSASNGGGIFLTRGILLSNNTIAENDAMEGSGVFVDQYSFGTGLVINNVIFGKSGQTAIHSESGSTLNPPLKNNILYSPTNDVYGGTYTNQTGINGNISADPLLSGAAFGYYGLRPGSPAIDAGDNNAPALPATDLNGAPRLIDGSGQGSAMVDIGAYEFDPDEPRTVLTGQPAGATRATAASITVGGQGIVSYRYAVDGGPFTTADTAAADPIVLSDLAGGTHAVAVIGKTSSRQQQVSSATVAEWTIDTIPPVTTAAPAGGTYSVPQTVTLTCNDNSGSGCAGTFYCLGGDCTPSTPYTGPIAVSTSTGLRFYSRDAFGYQEAIKTASYSFVGSIAGRVTDSVTGNGIQGVSVSAFNAATGSSIGYGYTDSSGTYQIAGLASGGYKIRFSVTDYIEQWYSGKADRSVADTVTVSAPTATTGIDVIMVKGGSITGVVTGKDTGAGLQNVSVIAYNAITGAWAGSGYSDSSGAYTVSGLPPGDYKLRFSSYYNVYISQWYNNKADLATANPVTVSGSGTTSGVNAVLLKGGSITGMVTDSVSGAAIANVYVTAIDAISGAWINSGSTSSSGVYTINGLAGNYKLVFTSTGYVEQWYSGKNNQAAANIVTVTPPNTTAGINVSLIKGASITGVVTDSSTGKGIQGAYVYAYNTITGSWVYSYLTDSSGTYSITGLTTGSYKLRFSADGYVEQWSGGMPDQNTAIPLAVTAPNTTAGINAGLVKGGVISGTVTGKDTSAGIQGVYVMAYYALSGLYAGYGYTDSSGAYNISGLASGRYKLQFTDNSMAGYLGQWYSNKDSLSTATVVDVIAPNTVTGINASLEKGGIITGTVVDRDTGNAIQGVSVTAYSATTGQWISYAYTDYSGAYSITGLETGSYKIGFSSTGYVNQWFDGKADQTSASIVTVTAPHTTANINVSLGKGGSISGTITDRVSGVGIASTYLYAIDRSTGQSAGSTLTDNAGGYTITGLPSGSYRLRIEPPSGTGYLGTWYGGQDSNLCAGTVSVVAPNSTAGIDSQLDMGGSISGRVTDAASGSGISGVSIFMTNTTSHTIMNTSTIAADPTGAYTIGGLPSGEYALTFSAPDYVRSASPAIVRVSAPAVISGVDALLARGGGISGRITDRTTGNGLGNILVDAVDTVTRSWVGSGMTDYYGDYTITGLPSGSYAVYYDGTNGDDSYGAGWKTLLSAATMATTTNRASAAPVTPAEPVSTTVPPVIPIVPPVPPPPIVPLPLPQVLPVEIPSTAQVFSIAAPAVTTGIDLMIDRMGEITGRVTDITAGTPLNWISVSAFDSSSGARVGSTIANMGYYSIKGVPSGSYRIQFASIQALNGGYQTTWYNSRTGSTVTTEVAVQAPETTSGIDARLARAGGISGRISVSNCPGPQFVNIRAYDATTGSLVGQTWLGTAYADRFTISALPPGNYKLAINPDEAGFVRQWYLGKNDMASAEPVTVSAGAITDLTDIPLIVGGGSISGKVFGNTNCTSLPASIKLYDLDSGGLVAEGGTSPDGSYQFSGLPDASYKLLFTMNQVNLWYRTPGETAQASPVIVSGGLAVTGINLTGVCPPYGVCGSDNGLTLAKAAPAALCANGIPSPITGSGHPWAWTCQGEAGTDPVSCSATIKTYTLSLSVIAASGKGDIQADLVSNDDSPIALFCPASFCSALYDYGKTVRLTAIPDSISLFSSWGGSCSEDPCDVTMTSPKAVSALFSRAYNFKNISRDIFGNSLAPLVSASNSGDEIRMLATELAIDSLALNKGLTLSGGWKGLYLDHDINPTTLSGTITVMSEGTTINDTVIKGGLVIQSGCLEVNGVFLGP